MLLATSDVGHVYYMIRKPDSAIFYLTAANKHLLSTDGGAENYLMNQLNLSNKNIIKFE